MFCCQVVTVNDYLARRDSEWVGQVHKFLGMQVGLIQQGLSVRHASCKAGIVTGCFFMSHHSAIEVSAVQWLAKTCSVLQATAHHALSQYTHAVVMQKAAWQTRKSGVTLFATPFFTGYGNHCILRCTTVCSAQEHPPTCPTDDHSHSHQEQQNISCHVSPQGYRAILSAYPVLPGSPLPLVPHHVLIPW